MYPFNEFSPRYPSCLASLLLLATVLTGFGVQLALADDIQPPRPFKVKPRLETNGLGGLAPPSADVVKEMHASQYILHARDGKLTKVPVEKILLPHANQTNPQNVNIFQAPDGTIWVDNGRLCKSTDGGRTWAAHERDRSFNAHFLQALDNGTLIAMGDEGEHPHTRIIFLTSSDEGRSWKKISEIPNPSKRHWGGGSYLYRLPDGMLIAGIGHPDHVFEQTDKGLVLKSGGGALQIYRSTDNGLTWTDNGPVHDWTSEGDLTVTASGKLFASHRYQRPPLPGDPPDLEKQTGSISPGWPYKHLLTMESMDNGLTWQNIQMITSVFGQTRGAPVALSDGTVIVIHDTRYGPGPAGSRAMISRDEGVTWEDEVYYMDYSTFVGCYADSIALDDDTVLSLVASSQAGNSWSAVADNTDHYLIRWKPIP